MFLAREIFELEKCKLDGRPSGFGVPYRFYVGIKTEFFDFIEQNRTFDSLGEDLGAWWIPRKPLASRAKLNLCCCARWPTRNRPMPAGQGAPVHGEFVK
jgi:hypothetical protein